MKKDTITLGRRDFTLQAALALLSGAVITIGCGGDDTSPAAPGPSAPAPAPTPAATDRTAAVSANHGHVATITAAQITAGNALALDIRGNSDHPHAVELSAAEVMAIARNERVSKTSSTDGFHNHTVTFN